MNRAYSTLLFSCIVLMLSAYPVEIFGQEKTSKPTLSQEDMLEFTRQSEQLVRFMEYAFNSIGDPNVSAREKDIIINQSYLKFFTSSKVQIEDDLVEGRFTVTNKEVQAYLKDLDFFFQNVEFTFTIEDISYNVNDKGQVFFIVTSTRNLSGKTVEGDSIYNNQARFIEINLDRDKRDLKIASIYTTKLSEKEDMRNWWASLDSDWRLYFAKGTMINENLPLKDIVSFEDGKILIERFHSTVIEGYVMETRRADTMFLNTGEIYREIGRIWKMESIDISDFSFISDLSPLAKLSELKTINISGSHVDDLTPIRNLTRLENLIISKTFVQRLDPLRHAINMKSLDISNTTINDLSPVSAFPSLERINFANTLVEDLTALTDLSLLRDIRLTNTPVMDLNPLGGLISCIVLDISNTNISSIDALGDLQSLERLHADNTKITDLEALTSLSNLQYLLIEGTGISTIQVLSGLPSLQRIYCDRTPITREEANKFMQENPKVLVIHESEALSTWWNGVPQSWRNVFGKYVPLSEPPTREELHEVANLTLIDISGNKEILSLSPLQKLLGLRSLLARETNIFTIETLKENIDLVELDVSSTHIQDIKVLANLRILETVKFAYTPVDDLSPLQSNYQLKHLDLEFTNVVSLLPITTHTNLEMVICDGIQVNAEELSLIYDANPLVTVIHQTEFLTEWWQNLPEAWVNILKSQLTIDNPPTKYDLHRMIDQHELDISNTRELQGLKHIELFHRLRVLKMTDLQVTDLASLGSLRNLEELYCSNNPISSLQPLGQMNKLTVLDCSNTMVRNLNDLRNLPNLRVLNISGTQVRSLRPLSNLHSLRQLDCYNTKIISLIPLESLKGLELLRCYNTNVWQYFINRFKRAVPDCEVVYY
ncbi:MAG: leucine-rich repeat domain-containing protein [Bacteroidales bacterium]|nr:leucine-rich repeat domain-containing protein [Bacteroidales bacterium]